MSKRKIPLLGESWGTSATRLKAFDQFNGTTCQLGGEPSVATPKDRCDVVDMPSHRAATEFPDAAAGLEPFAAIFLSEIGANALLLHPDVWRNGEPRPNRLKRLRAWTRRGGGLVTIGGCPTFQGVDVRGRRRVCPRRKGDIRCLRRASSAPVAPWHGCATSGLTGAQNPSCNGRAMRGSGRTSPTGSRPGLEGPPSARGCEP